VQASTRSTVAGAFARTSFAADHHRIVGPEFTALLAFGRILSVPSLCTSSEDTGTTATTHHAAIIFSTNAKLCAITAGMKGDHLGEFEELTLLAAWALRDDANGVTMGAVYASLDRLERKALLRSTFGDSKPERGGKRKRLFSVTPAGSRLLKEVRRVRDQIWQTIEAKRS
jgi:PadR family transcriptional regulator PadR